MEDGTSPTSTRKDQATCVADDRERDGALASFPFDRMTAQRFRQTFPRARWSDKLQAWTVPGKTARRRIDRWLAQEAARTDVFANERGRDAYAFEPILSPYLEVDDVGFRIRTPYSRTVVEELRQIPVARWDSDQRIWRVPFASYDDLQRRWETIEEAARRNEPEERRKRIDARKGTAEEQRSKRRSAERRRRRLPLPCDDLPPVGRPVATSAYGIVVVTEITGELADPVFADLYPELMDEHVWCHWELPTLGELVHTWPAKATPGRYERMRSWWQPTIEELREARRAARSRERRKMRPEALQED
ncbi:hypothetical protein [Rhizobium jaguaris]|uniref:HARP domain-containing protein n=1 Tax=Rhizobium jaguaris TaxID=1312183 RepID=A0A387G0F3_9HYPH|nr:hypothetical protein [Rhizobium jaguaris]AYG61691.1 hypothetical protein CCGE525_22645 [Rhizobium jaguaris]